MHFALLYIRHRQVIHTSSSHSKPLDDREPQGILYTAPAPRLALVERQTRATEDPQSGKRMDVAVQAAMQTGLGVFRRSDLLLPTTVPQSLLGMKTGPAARAGSTEVCMQGCNPSLFLVQLDAPDPALPSLMTHSGLSGRSCW